MVEAYSVASPEAVCAQVLEPFEETLSLDNLPAGTYTIYLNGEKIGDITVIKG